MNNKFSSGGNEALHLQPVKDYTPYLMVTSGYMAFIALIFALFFHTQHKRSDIDDDISKKSSVADLLKKSETQVNGCVLCTTIAYVLVNLYRTITIIIIASDFSLQRLH